MSNEWKYCDIMLDSKSTEDLEITLDDENRFTVSPTETKIFPSAIQSGMSIDSAFAKIISHLREKNPGLPVDDLRLSKYIHAGHNWNANPKKILFITADGCEVDPPIE